jgi:hypothetical protein
MKLPIGQHPINDLPIFREFTGEIKTNRKKERVLTVFYEEWQELPNGKEVFKLEKRYHVKDKPAITQEVLIDGTEDQFETIIITPATTKYTDWLNMIPDGTKTLEMIFEDAINLTLSNLPIDFPDGAII